MDAGLVGSADARFASARFWMRQGALLLAALLGSGQAQELIYSEVRTPQPVVAVGAELNLEVVLLDAYSAPIAAPETLELSVEIYRESDAEMPLEVYGVSLAAGEQSINLNIPMGEAGTFRIVATHPTLLSWDLFVEVYDPAGAAASPILLSSWFGTARAAPAVRPASPEQTVHQLKILTPASDRRFLVNGGSRARLQFFLYDAAGQPVNALEDVQVVLETDGELKPDPVVIKKGKNSAVAFLRSDQVGLIDVAFRGTIPTLKLHEDTRLDPVRFDDRTLKLSAVSQASLIEPVTLTLKLLGVDGNPLPTRVRREVTVVMVDPSRGRGVFKPVERTYIEKGDYHTRVNFIPTWPGRVELLAESARLVSVPSTVTVSLAPLWFAIVFTGGVVGSFVDLVGGSAGATAARVLTTWRVLARVFVGVVAGALLYWAYLFGILLPPLPAGASALLLHSLTAFFVPLLGAFAGVKVLIRLAGGMLPPAGGRGDGAT